MEKVNTFVIPIVRTDLLPRCLETLYAHTPDNFMVIVIDQSWAGVDSKLRDQYKNLMIIRTARTDTHAFGNLGHSQATNLGVRLAQTKYVTMLNDDVEFIHPGWWQGVLDTFELVAKQTPERPAFLVNAASIKLPDWSVGRPAGDDFYIIPYKRQYTDEDWRHLVDDSHYVNEHLTIMPGSVIDGINLYCSVVDREVLLKVGMLDEYWYPGLANDYDLCCRASMWGYRSVGTTLSWVFHHWSQTFNSPMPDGFIDPDIRRGDLRDKWGERFDLWGVKCERCGAVMRTADGMYAWCFHNDKDSCYVMPMTTMAPL